MWMGCHGAGALLGKKGHDGRYVTLYRWTLHINNTLITCFIFAFGKLTYRDNCKQSVISFCMHISSDVRMC